MSSKHPGNFKRISLPALNLLHTLVEMEYDEGEANIFYSRFVCSPLAELKKASFDMHVMSQSGGDDVLESVKLLAELRNDHRTDDGLLDPIEIEELLTEKESREILTQWMRSTGDAYKYQDMCKF